MQNRIVEGNREYENSFHPYYSQHKGSFVFKHLCQYCIVLDIHKGVMTSTDVKGECHITIMTGMCVNKPDQTEPVGCYENLIIPNFAKCM